MAKLSVPLFNLYYVSGTHSFTNYIFNAASHPWEGSTHSATQKFLVC